MRAQARASRFASCPTCSTASRAKPTSNNWAPCPWCGFSRSRFPASARLFKRSVDLIVSSLILFFTAPLWLLIAIAIKLETRGPVFYRQERVGMDGHIFLIYKFRSMRDDVEIDDAHRDYMAG